MNLRLAIYDDSSNPLANLKICQIKPMTKLRGIGGRLALHSTLFDSIEANKRECEEHLGDFNFYNPNCELFIPNMQDEFFYFYCDDNGTLRLGIIKIEGNINAYSNFDDALILSDDFILLKKDNKYGFINALKTSTSLIEYKKLDLQPTLTMAKQGSLLGLASIATKTIGFNDYQGALDEFGNILIPFEYTRIEYHVTYVTVYKFGDNARIPISELSPTKSIQLTPTTPDDNCEPYDPDPWGAKSEMDYIRNNGGDWIDD